MKTESKQDDVSRVSLLSSPFCCYVIVIIRFKDKRGYSHGGWVPITGLNYASGQAYGYGGHGYGAAAIAQQAANQAKAAAHAQHAA